MNDMSFEVSHQSRRAALAERLAAETGIDDLMIEVLVRRFYEKVRADALLGSIFETRIRDWEPHLKRMCDFWSSVALMTGRYHGTPMAKHLPLPVEAEHFDRWLALFEETAREICRPRPLIISSSARGELLKVWRSESPVSTAPFSREVSAIGTRARREWGWRISRHGPNASKSSRAGAVSVAGGWRPRARALAYVRTDAHAWWSWTISSPRLIAPKVLWRAPLLWRPLSVLSPRLGPNQPVRKRRSPRCRSARGRRLRAWLCCIAGSPRDQQRPTDRDAPSGRRFQQNSGSRTPTGPATSPKAATRSAALPLCPHLPPSRRRPLVRTGSNPAVRWSIQPRIKA